MRNIPHKSEDDPQIFLVDVILSFDAFADQPQDFQTTEDHLMLTCARRCCLHAKTPAFKSRYIVFESLMGAKDSSRNPAEQALFVLRFSFSKNRIECRR